MGELIFFPVKAIVNYPSEEELQHRQDLQAEINSYRFRVIYSEPDPYQRLLKAQYMLNMFLDKIELIK
jgi:hypothetical protein